MVGYGGLPASSTTDEVRFWIGDTDSTNYEFTDAEISYLLAKYTDPILTAAHACQRLAITYAREPNISLGEYSESSGSISAMYAARASELMKTYNDSLSGTTLTIPTTISKVRDSVAENYPARFRHVDVEQDAWGHEDEDVA
jgi:hypothetical protein